MKQMPIFAKLSKFQNFRKRTTLRFKIGVHEIALTGHYKFSNPLLGPKRIIEKSVTEAQYKWTFGTLQVRVTTTESADKNDL